MNNGIIVKFENFDKIEKVLTEANGKGQKGLINFYDVSGIADKLTEKLKGINKENLVVQVNWYAQELPPSHKNFPASYKIVTLFTLLFKHGKWRLLSADRASGGKVIFKILHMEEATKASILKKFVNS